MAALIPLFIIVLGPTLTARVVIVFVFTFVIVAVDTRAGVRSVDSTIVEMAQSFGASERQIWQRILLPGALPAIIAGLRVGLGRAFTGMVLSELLLVGVGVGRLMLKYRGSFDGDYLYATILLVVLEAIICTLLLRLLETRTLSWASDASQ
jgi:ABC-type nitrate/sulfonate/bicarbonate transport system permease component